MATATVMAPAVPAEGLCGAGLESSSGEPDPPADGDGLEPGSNEGGQCLGSGRFAEELSSKRVEVEAAAEFTSTPPEERPVLADGSAEAFPSEPPEEAALQTDGRPEPNREDLVGELEVEKCTSPAQEESNAIDNADPAIDGQGNASLIDCTSAEGDASDSSKHPLENRWCSWVNRRAKLQANLSWSERGILAYEFETAEDFWCMHHHSFPPSELENIDCSLFKKGLTPSWDDPMFGCGGRWVVRLEKVSAPLLDSLWLSLNMALVGEGFADLGGDVVGGAIVSVRNRTTRIALWLTKATDEKKVMATGFGFRDILVDAEGATDMESKEFVFEDFRTQAINLQLPRPGVTGLTEGIFQ